MSGPGSVIVRTLAPDEWETHRRVRLAALRIDPDAFGATLASSEALGEDDWRGRCDTRSWFALIGDRPAGMARLWFDPASKPVPEIISVWVDPAHRGAGVGRRLVAAALAAADGLAGQADLWVVDSNLPALRLYESLGFRITGETQALPDGRRELHMLWKA